MKKMLLFISSFALSLSFFGYADQTRSLTDDELSHKINHAIEGGWFSEGFDNVSFDNENGNITLKGTVDSAEDKEEVEARVKKVDGVKNVDDQILVQTDKSDKPEKKTAKKIRKVLKGGWFTKGYEGVTFELSDGEVTLMGTVDSESDREEVQKRIEKIDGVKEVSNQIQVQPKQAK